MKWIRMGLIYALFFGLLVGLPGALKLDKSPPDGLAARKYEGYAGVLKVWLCEEWSGGALCTWLNQCTTAFEKNHKGVYVQLTQTSRAAMAQFVSAQVVPPDALIFAPGVLEGAQGLAPLEEQDGLRECLTEMGRTEEGLFALPIALGGYGLALNRSLLEALPEDWSALELACPALNVPADEEGRSWSAALIALFAGLYATESGEPARAGEGLELGLPTQTPAAQATAQPEQLDVALPGQLPEDFRRTESVYNAFLRGETAAIPVTQREIRRLALLSEQGKAPDYAVAAYGAAFTDQAALFAVSAAERPEREARIALCKELLQWLLSDEMQGRLTLSRAFRVTDGAFLYPAVSEMRALEEQLARAELWVPPAFSSAWRQTASALCDRVQAGELTPREAFLQMSGG